jgi:hypothetical protein
VEEGASFREIGHEEAAAEEEYGCQGSYCLAHFAEAAAATVAPVDT